MYPKRTVNDTLRCQEHDSSKRSREYDVLARIEERERGCYLDRRLLVRAQVCIVPVDLVSLVVEILYALCSRLSTRQKWRVQTFTAS